MLKRIILMLLISFSFFLCTSNVNVQAKELNQISSINTLEINHTLADLPVLSLDRCKGVFGDPSEETSTAWLIQKVVEYMRIIGILLVLALSGVDLIKGIILSDAESMKNIKNHLITRLLGIVLLFVLPAVIKVLLQAFGLYSGCGTSIFEGQIIKLIFGLKV